MPIFHQYNRIPSIQVLSRVLIGILSLMEIEAFIEKKEPPPKQLIDGLRDIHGNIYAWKVKNVGVVDVYQSLGHQTTSSSQSENIRGKRPR